MKTIAQQLNITEFPFVIKDSQGNQIYYENSYGGWYKQEYDSQGNEIYYENLTGFWLKSEYDSNGNIIYSENLTGFWLKSEYDSNGNIIYSENSDGLIIDKRPKPSCEGKTVEIDGVKYKLVNY
jgi:hypothetical protein